MIRETTNPCRMILAASAWRLVCVLLLLSAACKQKPAQAPPPPPKVTVSQPLRQNVIDYLELTGNTQAVNTVQLLARVEGYLEKVFFRDGEMVKKGQSLFLIQQNTYRARLQQAEGNVLTQKAFLEHAKTEFARYTNLYKQKAASQQDVENWAYQRNSAEAAIMTVEAQRDLAKLDLSYTLVTAPFSGRIDRRLVDPGNLVGSAGTNTPLAQITQIDPLYIYVNISERDISRFIRGSDGSSGNASNAWHPIYVGFANEKDHPHEGYVDFTATSVSSSTGTLLLRGVLSNADGGMLPGQYARVKLPVGEERSAILVPQAAVSFDQLGSYVLVVNDKEVVERRNVKTGTPKENLYVIEDGLSGNERVIVKGLLRALPGSQVTPEQEAAVEQSPAEEPKEPNQQKAGK